jgi:hypothetical protein
MSFVKMGAVKAILYLWPQLVYIHTFHTDFSIPMKLDIRNPYIIMLNIYEFLQKSAEG